MPISFFCLASGPRYISGTRGGDVLSVGDGAGAGLGVADLCRDPEPRNALIGGTILITALVAHAGWQLNRVSRRRAGRLSGHPI